MPNFDPNPFFAHDVMKVLKKPIEQYASEYGIPESPVAAKFDLAPDGRGHTLLSEIYVANKWPRVAAQ